MMKTKILKFAVLFAVFAAVLVIHQMSFAARPASVWGGYFNLNNSSFFHIDEYAVVIENTMLNDAYASMRLSVLPQHRYRISAMVRVENFRENFSFGGGGASVGVYGIGASPWHINEEWVRLEFEFDTGEMTEATFVLRNGRSAWSTSRGNAHFTDIVIERAPVEQTTNWNILALVFLHVDVPNVVQDSLNLSDVMVIRRNIDRLHVSVPLLSNGLMGIDTIDHFVIEEPITQLMGSFQHIDQWAIAHILDEYLARGDYHHIILVSPLADMRVYGWLGLGGMVYRGIGVSEVNYRSGELLPHLELTFVHEILHDLERISRTFRETAYLHEQYYYYGYRNIRQRRMWYAAYMQNLPELDGRGIDPRSFAVYTQAGDFVCVFEEEASLVSSPAVLIVVAAAGMLLVFFALVRRSCEERSVGHAHN